MEITKQTLLQNKNDLKKLNRQQKSHIAAKEQEIEQVKKIYKDQVLESKIKADDDIQALAERNKIALIQANNIQTSRLEKLKENLDHTQKTLNKEEIQLKKFHQEKMSNENQLFEEKFQDSFTLAEEKNRQLGLKINNDLKDTKSLMKRELERSSYDTKLKLDKVSHQNQQEILKAQNGQALSDQRANNEYTRLKAQNEMAHAKSIQNQLRGHQGERLTKERIHKDQLAKDEAHNQSALLNSEKAFKERYKNVTDAHQQVMKNLQVKFDQEINALTKASSKSRVSKESRITDTFYNLETLSPKVEDKLDHYIVSIKVPRHERNNYVLNADKRTLRLSMSRRYNERMEDKTGVIHSGNRSETFSKEFQVADIMDPQEITQKWDNGILSYKILKA